MTSRNQGLPSNVLQIAHGSRRARMDISEQLGIRTVSCVAEIPRISCHWKKRVKDHPAIRSQETSPLVRGPGYACVKAY